jgi:Fe-S oxidoreductase
MSDFRKTIREECLEREDAFCTAECPFRLDVREFVARLSRGGFNSAYRLYSNAVGFPAVVSAICDEPCRAVCARKTLDEAVSLRLLEDACVRHASNTKPNNYNLPAKNLRIAIVGGGAGGLACALRLANKKYDVTVFDGGAEPGGSLLKILGREIASKEIASQFMYERYTFMANTPVNDIEPLALSYGSVYISTGASGNDFGLIEGNIFPLATRVNGVFLGGETTGASCVESIAHGLDAANLIESYLKTEIMKSVTPAKPTRMILDPGALKRAEIVRPSAAGRYTKEEAILEAFRCARCRCDACYRHCSLMAYYNKAPKKLEEEIEATINPGTLDGDGTIVTRFIATCNQCGLCGEICPVGIDMGEMMLASHRALNAKGAMPWAFHEFWLRDMEFANGERAFLAAAPPAGDGSGYVFFPGCQLGASEPRYVTETYKYILGKISGAAIAVMCCGAPLIWAGEAGHEDLTGRIRDVFAGLGASKAIMACPTCLKMFKKYLPEIETTLLYDFMARNGAEVKSKGCGEAVSVFDPCAVRHAAASCENIRRILKAADYRMKSLPYEGRAAQCCSWGGQISAAAPNYAKWLVKERISEGENPYVVYCSNCRDIFAGAGKPVKHILDIAFGIRDWASPPPTASQRRRNRTFLKRTLLREYWPEASGGEEDTMPKFRMGRETREKLDRQHLIEEDIETVIESCEAGGRFVIDPETSHRHGYGVVGNLTHWVEYATSDEGLELINAYSHRMAIELEDVWNGRKQERR